MSDFLIGFGLTFIGYVTNVVQTPETIIGLQVLIQCPLTHIKKTA